MAYCDTDDLVLVLSTYTQYVPAAPATFVADWIDLAAGVIDGWLAKRGLTVVSTTDTVRLANANLAVYYILRSKFAGSSQDSDSWVDAFRKDAVKLIDGISAREDGIDRMTGVGPFIRTGTVDAAGRPTSIFGMGEVEHVASVGSRRFVIDRGTGRVISSES